jgi:hypothetical protein
MDKPFFLQKMAYAGFEAAKSWRLMLKPSWV